MENKTSSTSQNSNANQTENQQSGFNMDDLTGMMGNLNIPETLKKYCGSATKAIGNLSTTQKVIGGALLLLGAGYLSRKSKGGFNLKNFKNKRK